MLEKLHYIEKEGGYWVLHHELVPLDYHYVESLDEFQHIEEDCKQESMEKFSLTECSKGDGCRKVEEATASI